MASPVELQDNLSKAPLAARQQHIQQSSAELGQRHAAQALEQEHVLDQSRTRGMTESDAAANRVDDHEGKEGHRRGDQRARSEDDSATTTTDSDDRPSPSDTSREIDLVA